MKRCVGILALILVFIASGFAQDDKNVSPSLKNPKAAVLLKRAFQLDEAQRNEEAIEAYKEVLKVEPKDFAAMNSIAGLYGRLNDPENEIIWAKKSIETKPDHFLAYINYGNALATMEKYGEAIAVFEKAQSIAPEEPLPVYSLGVVAENQKKIKEALDFYKKSIELDPKFEDGIFSAAAMYGNLKQYDEAITLLNSLLVINPKYENAQYMLDAIRQEKAKNRNNR